MIGGGDGEPRQHYGERDQKTLSGGGTEGDVSDLGHKASIINLFGM